MKTSTASIIAEELAMTIHLAAGSYLDRGFDMATIQEAVRKAADLLPGLEDDAVECS